MLDAITWRLMQHMNPHEGQENAGLNEEQKHEQDQKNQGYSSRTIRSFVVRGGRMSPAQEAAWRELSPRFVIPYTAERLETAAVYGNDRPLVVEIGFGMGKATWMIARDKPDINYLGIEVHRPGVGRLLWEMREHGLENIRIIEHDAVEVLENMLPEASVSAFHIFFPDTWPKKKHHKRRLVRRPFTDLLASRLAPGGYVYCVSDWAEYGEEALAELTATPMLENHFESFAPPQNWRPETKFERKGLDREHVIREVLFERKETP